MLVMGTRPAWDRGSDSELLNSIFESFFFFTFGPFSHASFSYITKYKTIKIKTSAVSVTMSGTGILYMPPTIFLHYKIFIFYCVFVTFCIKVICLLMEMD